jgi:hypothetical protein
MKTLPLLWLAALAGGMSAPALAQPAAAPHQHAQPAAPAQGAQAGQHKEMQGTDARCDCCEMMKQMKQMMQMMRTMHQHSGERGMKMDMMQSPGPAPQGSAPPAAAEHQHEDKPRD